MKTCSKCGIKKDVIEFYKSKANKDGLRGWCKGCVKTYAELNSEKIKSNGKKYRDLNPEKRKEYAKNYYIENPEKFIIKDVEAKKEYNKERYRIRYELDKENIKDKTNKYYHANKEKCNFRSREYAKLNRDKINKYVKEKKATDPLFRLKNAICKSVFGSFKRCKFIKKGRTNEIIGLSFEDFKIYLENKFEDWMNWDNYGK